MTSQLERSGMIDLSEIAPGFSDSVHDSQRCFRAALHALSNPGSIVPVTASSSPPQKLARSAADLLLTMLDSDCSLWLSASVRHRAIADYFRFHTGCKVVDEPQQASFALIGDELELPRLARFNWGSDSYPDRSATVVIQVTELSHAGPWFLTGPGIEQYQTLRAGTLPLWFLDDWEQVSKNFPRGVDLFLCANETIAALARTTRITLRA